MTHHLWLLATLRFQQGEGEQLPVKSGVILERLRQFNGCLINTISDLIALVAHNSALVHELQKERGLSAGYLGNRSEQFAKKLKQQRNLTDWETR